MTANICGGKKVRINDASSAAQSLQNATMQVYVLVRGGSSLRSHLSHRSFNKHSANHAEAPPCGLHLLEGLDLELICALCPVGSTPQEHSSW